MKKLFLTLAACIIGATLWAQGYKLDGHNVVPDGNILFEKGSAKLSRESEAALGNIKKYLDDKSYISLLRVEGHVDGSGDANQSLSEARANAVCHWLVSKGIDCKRLLPVGFADTKPVSYESNVLNTRITFVNAELRGRAIGGMPVDGGGKVAGDACKQ